MGAKLSRGAGRGNVTIDGTSNVAIVGTPTVTFGTVSMPSITVASMPIITSYTGWLSATGTNVFENAGGHPMVCNQEYGYAIAEGDIAGHTGWGILGTNSGIGTVDETLWDYSSAYVFPTTTGQMEISSTSPDDSSSGIGVQSVTAVYLKSDYTQSSCTFTTNGTNWVASGGSHADMWRINAFVAMTAGTSKKAVGNIILRQVVGTTVHGYIVAGKTQARQAFYTVPSGKTVYITGASLGCAGTKYIVFTVRSNSNPLTSTVTDRGIFYPGLDIALLNSNLTTVLPIPRVVRSTVDLKVEAIAEAAGSYGTCSLSGWIE